MQKENDQLTALFRSRLNGAELTVRDGFWEELEQAVPVALLHRRKVLFYRISAVASVVLVLLSTFACIWYCSPKEEVKQAFAQVAVSSHASLNGDRIQVDPLPITVEPVLSRSHNRVASGSALPLSSDEDSVSMTLSMSFSFSVTQVSDRSSSDGMNRRSGFEEQALNQVDANERESTDRQLSESVRSARADRHQSSSKWALKAHAGVGLPADQGTHKAPLSVGVEVERKLNERLSVETGLNYSFLRSDGQRLHYLGIPLKANYTLLGSDHIDCYLSGGGLLDKCIAGAPNNGFGHEPIQLSLMGGVGIRYKLNESVALFVEPTIIHHFKTDSELATVRTSRPTAFNLLCGIRMTY